MKTVLGAFLFLSFASTSFAQVSSDISTECTQTARMIDRYRGASINNIRLPEIESLSPGLTFQVLPPSSAATADRRTSRVRILVNEKNEILSAICG